MLLGKDVRVCIAYSETDDEMENSMNDERSDGSRLHLARYISLGHSECSSTATERSNAAVSQKAGHMLLPASHCGRQ